MNEKRELDTSIDIIAEVKSEAELRHRQRFGERLTEQIAIRGTNTIKQRIVVSRDLSRVSSVREVKERYIAFKIMNGLSKDTIVNTHSFFKLLYRFIAFITIEDEEQLNRLTEEEIYEKIPSTPIMVLEAEYFEELFRAYLIQLGKKETTIHTDMMRLKTFYTYCSDELKIIRPKTIKLKQPPTPIKSLYTDEQLDILLTKPKDYRTNHKAHRNWVIYNYAYNTGNRRLTICNIRMKDLSELDDGFIVLNRTKNKKPQRIVVPYKLVKILKEYISIWRYDAAPDDFLFVNHFGDGITPEGLTTLIAKSNRELLGENAPTSIHLFRHQYAAEYIKDEGSMFDLQKQLGHSTLDMVRHYAEHYGRPNAENIVSHAPINRRKQSGVREKIKPKE